MKIFLKIFFVMMLMSVKTFGQSEWRIKIFKESMLTENEKTLCTRFKAMKGHDRYDIFMQLDHLFPASMEDSYNRYIRDSCATLITEETLVSMLGKPDYIQDRHVFKYVLFLSYSSRCMVQFGWPKDGIILHSFIDCSEKR